MNEMERSVSATTKTESTIYEIEYKLIFAMHMWKFGNLQRVMRHNSNCLKLRSGEAFELAKLIF